MMAPMMGAVANGGQFANYPDKRFHIQINRTPNY